MRGRVVGANGGAPTDLLVCFPSKAHLGLIPKPICSPSRPGEPGKRNVGKAGGGRGQASPLFKNKSKNLSNEIADEPTSPKVTCAGQIKVRPKPRPRPNSSSSKNWLSVVEEIERFHKEKKRPHWLEGLGIKKDVMQLLRALRGLRFDMRCFGSLHGAVDCSSGDEEDDDEDEEQEEEEDNDDGDDEDEDKSNSSNSRTIFSKWFMVLEESQSNACKKEEEEEEEEEKEGEKDEAPSSSSSSVPPPNALLLMRCRSAPAKGWVDHEGDEGERRLEEEKMSARTLREDEKEKERLILMSYAPDFFKVSTDIAKETWVVGGMDPLARSRSWRR